MIDLGSGTSLAHIVHNLMLLVEKKVTPPDLNGWAIDNGLVGRLSPFNEVMWTLPFASLWIAWRSEEIIERQWLDVLYLQRGIWSYPPKENQKLSLEVAEKTLWDFLEKGKLVGNGIDLRTGERVDIEGVKWRDLRWSLNDPMRALVSTVDSKKIKFVDCCVPREASLNLWPDVSALARVDNLEIRRADTSPPKPMGAPQKYDWAKAGAFVASYIIESDYPKEQSDLIHSLCEWFKAEGKMPDQRDVERFVAAVYNQRDLIRKR